MNRILALAVATLIVVLAAILYLMRDDPPAPQEVPVGPDRASRPEIIVRGEYLARAGDCYACHTVRGGEPYAGGLEMATPFGVLYTPNITPDPETGIGKWTAEDFWRALHDGRSKDGSFLYPAFPFTNYTRVTREDADAIFTYFRSVKPVRQVNRAHALGFPYNQRELMLAWRTLYFRAGVHQDDPKQTQEWNRGAYLVQGLGHCNACHATRNVFGAISADDDFSGGLIPVQNWYAPSLTSSRETGLGDWDVKDIVDLLRTGVAARGAVFGPMADVVQHSLQYLSLTDLTAMAVYLKAQSQKSEPADPPQVRMTALQAEDMMKTGAKIYDEQCASCHQPNGEGVPRVYPPLANNEAISMRFPVNAIRIVMNGGFPPSTEGNPRPYGMPPFRQALSDDEIAAVVTYLRQSWGNTAPAVSPAEVARFGGVPTN